MTAYDNIKRAILAIGLGDFFKLDSPLSVQRDRVLFQVTSMPDLEVELIKRGWTMDAIIDPIHGGAIASYREQQNPSLQICTHQDAIVEVDLDFYNPWYGDVWSFIGHGCEVFYHVLAQTKTDPDRMSKALDKRFGKL